MPDYAYITTTGRKTGQPRTIEIWYAEHEGVIYVLSGGRDRSQWVKNLIADPQVRVRLGGPRERRPDMPGTLEAIARPVADPGEAQLAGRLLDAKYHGWQEGKPLSRWAQESLAVAIYPDTPQYSSAI